MNIEYKRENHKSYCIIKQSMENEISDLYDLKILQQNKISNLLPYQIQIFNDEYEIYYDISGKQSIESIFERKKLGINELNMLFSELQDKLSNLEEFLLDIEKVCLSPECIYLDINQTNIFLMYQPFEQEKQKFDTLPDFLLNHLCHEDEKAVITAYSFYRYMKTEDGDILSALSLLNEELDLAKEESVVTPQEIVMPTNIIEEENCYKESDQELSKEILHKDNRRKISYFFISLGVLVITVFYFIQTMFQEALQLGLVFIIMGIVIYISTYIKEKKREKSYEKTILEETSNDWINSLVEEPVVIKEEELDLVYQPTVLLEDCCYKEERILIGKIHGKKKQIELTKFPFIIGKRQENVDFIINDKTISQIHAKFALSEEVVFLTDLNSTNGTYHNGIKLTPNERVMLEKEDEISFGKLHFTYY